MFSVPLWFLGPSHILRWLAFVCAKIQIPFSLPFVFFPLLITLHTMQVFFTLMYWYLSMFSFYSFWILSFLVQRFFLCQVQRKCSDVFFDYLHVFIFVYLNLWFIYAGVFVQMTIQLLQHFLLKIPSLPYWFAKHSQWFPEIQYVFGCISGLSFLFHLFTCLMHYLSCFNCWHSPRCFNFWRDCCSHSFSLTEFSFYSCLLIFPSDLVIKLV